MKLKREKVSFRLSQAKIYVFNSTYFLFMSNEPTSEVKPSNTTDRFCFNCGTELKANASFCVQCGIPFGHIHQPQSTIPFQPSISQARKNVQIFGAILSGVGVMLIILAGVLWFISWGWLYRGSIISVSPARRLSSKPSHVASPKK